VQQFYLIPACFKDRDYSWRFISLLISKRCKVYLLSGAACASSKKITFGFFSIPQVRNRSAEGAWRIIECNTQIFNLPNRRKKNNCGKQSQHPH
jgi:hypothetical protein